MRQRLELLGHVGVAVVRRLVVAEPADPDLEPGVLLELAQRAERIEAGVDLVGQELELAAGEVGLGVPEQPVLGGERLGQLGLEPVDLAAELRGTGRSPARSSRRASSTSRVTSSRSSRVCRRVRSISALRRRDQLLGVGLGGQRRLVLGQLAHQVLEQLLVVVGLLQRAEAGRPDRPQPLDGAPRPQLGRAELLGGVLRLPLDLPRPRLRLRLTDQLGELL